MPTDLPLRRAVLAPPLLVDASGDRRRRDTIAALAIIALYALACITYGLLSHAPWDDDCVNRYFNTLKAWHDPKQFFDLWNRPLFVLLFAPTALLGKTAVMLQMVLIAAFSGWMLFLAVRRMGAAYPYMVLPLFFFQIYYFSTSRNNLTEPLAVALICIGLYALVHERYLLFTLMGALIPLARLELSVVVMPVWALILLLQRRWKYLPVLLVPLLLMMIGGYLVRESGGLFWLVKDTVAGSNETNRYGHTDFWHYFARFGFVIGPVVFLFFIVGFLERIARRRLDLFVVLQFVAIFLLYVLFSWKLNMGNAAGFLRNLIPLTPFIALIALDGFLAWAGLLASPMEDASAPADRKHQQQRAAAGAKTRRSAWTRTIAWSLVAVWLFYTYYSVVLRSHHKITTEVDYQGTLVIGTLALVLLIAGFAMARRGGRRWMPAVLGGLAGAGALAYLLVTEPPDAHLSPERRTLNRIAKVFTDPRLDALPVYCDNVWFYWPYDLGYPSSRFHFLNQANVEAAPAHALFVWDTHYSNRLGNDASPDFMSKRKDLVELCRAVSDDQGFTAVVYQKTNKELNDGNALLSGFETMFPDLPYIYCSRALRESTTRQDSAALADAAKMLTLDSTFVYGQMVAGMVNYNAGRFGDAIGHYQRMLALDTGAYGANLNIGLCLQRMGKAKEAIPYFKKMLHRDPRAAQAQEALANAYYQLADYGQAYTAFTNALRLSPQSAGDYMGRGNCCFQTGKFKEAVDEYDLSLKVQPKQPLVLKNKGLALLQLGRRPEACQQFQQALMLGDAQAVQLMATNCQ